MKFKQALKKLTIFILLGVVLVSLFACKAKEKSKIPYGNIDEKVILTAKDNGKEFEITEKTLYNLFRNKSSDILKRIIDHKVLEEQFKEIDNILADEENPKNKDYKKFLIDEVNQTVFAEKDINLLRIKTKDQLYQNFIGFKGRKSMLKDFKMDLLEEKVNTELEKENHLDRNFQNYDKEILKLGYPKLAKRILAYNYLTEEKHGPDKNQALIDIEKDPYYINPKSNDYLKHFEKEYAYKHDVNFFAVDFINQEEFDLAQAKLEKPVKIASNGEFYLIPDIRIKQGEPGFVDITEAKVFKDGKPNAEKNNYNYDYEYTYLYKLIKEKIIGKPSVRKDIKNPEDLIGNLTLDEYKLYIKEYSPEFNEDNKRHNDIKLEVEKGDYRIINFFVDLYNLIYKPEKKLTVSGEKDSIVIKQDTEIFKTNYTYEEMKDSRLKDFIYKDLKFTTKEEKVGGETKRLIDYNKNTFYSTKLSNKFGNRFFFVYKITDNTNEVKIAGDYTLKDIYNYEKNQFTLLRKTEDPEKAESVKEHLPKEVYTLLHDDLIKEKASESLGNVRFDKLLEEKKVFVYDPMQRISFDQGNVEYSKDKFFLDDDTIAQVGDTKISVREFYEEMFYVYGIDIAIAHLIEEITWEKYQDKLTDIEKNDQKNALEVQLSNFSQGADHQYSPTMGRSLYLQHKFGYDNTRDVLVHFFYKNKVKEHLTKEIPEMVDDYPKKLTEFSNHYYDKKFEVKVSHILYSVDFNLDGTPDNPNSKELIEKREDIINAIKEITIVLNDVASKVGDSEKESYKKAIERYSETPRIEKVKEDFATTEDWLDYKESAKYKFVKTKQKVAIDLKLEENMTITETSFSQYDSVFYNRAKELYPKYKDLKEKDFPKFDFETDPKPVENKDYEKYMSNFGWHNIIVEEITKPKSAKMKKEYVSEIKLEDGTEIKAAQNLDDKVSLDQVKAYLQESKTKYKVKIDSDEEVMKNKGQIGSQISPIHSKITVYGEFGNLLILKTYDIKSQDDSIQKELDKFKNNKKEAINSHSKYNTDYQSLWETPDGSESIVDFFLK